MRKYISYENVAALIGPPSGNAKWDWFAGASWDHTTRDFNQLIRVQSASFGLSNNRVDLGQIASTELVGSPIVSQPEVTLGFSYLVTDGCNEKLAGMYVGADKTCIYNMLQNPGSVGNALVLAVYDSDEKEMNYAKDINSSDVVGFGNSYLSRYALSLEVGNLPAASLTYSCSNVNFTTSEMFSYGTNVPLNATRAVLDNKIVGTQTLVRHSYDGGNIGWSSAAEAGQSLVNGTESPSIYSSSSTPSTSAKWSSYFAGDASVFKEFSEKPYFVLRDGGGVDMIVKLRAYEGDKYITEVWEKTVDFLPPIQYGETVAINESFITGYYPSINLEDGLHRKKYQYYINERNFSGEIGGISALRPGDIDMKISDSQVGQRTSEGEGLVIPIQSFNVDLPISREKLFGMGSNYNYNQKILLPLKCEASISMNQTEFEESNLDELLNSESLHDFTVDLNDDPRGHYPSSDKNRKLSIQISDAKLQNQSYSFGVGGVATVSLSFFCQVNDKTGMSIY